MKRRPDLIGRLSHVQRKIISVKRQAKRSVGPRKEDWPETLREKYEDLCAKARMIQAWLEDANGKGAA